MTRELHPNPQVGHALRWLRQSRGLQQQELAQALEAGGRGVSTVWLSQVENGRRQPSRHLVQRLLSVLKADHTGLNDLLTRRPWDVQRVEATPRRETWADTPAPLGPDHEMDSPPAVLADLARELGELNAAYLALSPLQRAEALADLRRRADPTGKRDVRL